MRNFVLLGLLVVLLVAVGCDLEGEFISTPQQPADVKYDFKVVVIDSCHYVYVVGQGNIRGIAHAGKCPNHVEKK